MQTPKRSSDFWFPIIEKLEVSDMTQAQFAEAHGIKVATLRYWIYKFRDQQSETSAFEFVELKTIPEPKSPAVSMFLSQEVMIEFSQSPEPRFFAQLVHELSKLSC